MEGVRHTLSDYAPSTSAAPRLLDRIFTDGCHLVINVLTMTTLDRGWAVPDRIMSPFPPPGGPGAR